MSPFQPAGSDVIRWRMHLRSSPQAVYRALTTDQGRASFWSESAVQEEDRIHFEFINGVSETARVLDSKADALFRIRYFDATVTFELDPADDGGTDLILETTGFDPSEREELLAGWLNVLFPLKAAVDHGIDLRNHDPARTWDDGWADQ